MPEGNDGPEPEKTLTQEQVDKIVEERLARERKKYEDYDDLKAQVKSLTDEKKQLEEEGKSDSEKVSEQLTALKEQLEEEKEARTKSEAEALRLRVAQSKGLTEAQAKRLQGSTQEELEEDADDLLETFGGKDEKPEKKGGLGAPREALTPGASNEDDDTEVSAKEAKEIAERISSRNTI